MIWGLIGSETARFSIARSGAGIHVQRTGATGPWRLQLVNVPSVESVKGGALETDPQGVVITADAEVETLEVVIR